MQRGDREEGRLTRQLHSADCDLFCGGGEAMIGAKNRKSPRNLGLVLPLDWEKVAIHVKDGFLLLSGVWRGL